MASDIDTAYTESWTVSTHSASCSSDSTHDLLHDTSADSVVAFITEDIKWAEPPCFTITTRPARSRARRDPCTIELVQLVRIPSRPIPCGPEAHDINSHGTHAASVFHVQCCASGLEFQCRTLSP